MNNQQASGTTTEIAHSLLALLPLLNRIVAENVRREAGNETTVAQFRVLAHLSGGALTLSTLARRRRISLQAMGEVVQAVVERGWVERQLNPADRRQSLLHLTPAGAQQYRQVYHQAVAQLLPPVEQLSAEERKAVGLALHALHRVFTGNDDEPGGFKHPE